MLHYLHFVLFSLFIRDNGKCNTLITLLTESIKESVNSVIPVRFLLLRYSVFLLLSPYLCFISLFYLDLYVLGDDASIS